MCSRYSLISSPTVVQIFLRHRNEVVFPPRYNIAPTQPTLIARLGHAGVRELVLVRWGLIPSWVKDPGTFALLINARAETAAEKPSFQAAIRHRRCLIPADAFYEWGGPKTRRRPHLIRRRDGCPMAFAGLHEHWQGADGSEIETMVILTVPASATVAALHERMPALLEPGDFDAWLDCRGVRVEEALSLLRPAQDSDLEMFEISSRLNDPRVDRPDLVEPVGPQS